jgi:hypothetical protein
VPGSTMTRSRSGARDSAPARIAFCRLDDIGAPIVKSFATQWLARTHPCQRFARGLATVRA